MPKGGKRTREGKSQKGHLRVVQKAGTAVSLAPDLDPWLRQPDETDKAFAAFVCYRDLPPGERSVPNARASDEAPSANLRTWQGWSAKWSWVERSLAWDDENDRLRRQAHRGAIEEMSERHAQAGQVYVQTILQPALALLRHIRDNPDFMQDLVANNPMQAFAMIEKLAKALPLAVNVERLARGEPLNIEEIEARLHDVEGARDAAKLVLDDPEAAVHANELLERLYRAG